MKSLFRKGVGCVDRMALMMKVLKLHKQKEIELTNSSLARKVTTFQSAYSKYIAPMFGKDVGQ